MRNLVMLLLVCVAVAACGTPSDDTAPVAPLAEEATPVVAVAQSSAVEPAEETLAPTAIVDAFVAAGLPAESPTPMTVDDYGMAPYVCDGVRFLIPSLGDDSGGRAFVCASDADLASLREYYESLGRASAIAFSWVFANEDRGVLVQINGELPEEEARKYEAAVTDLK